ncbi:PDZ domain-containing protein, partial [candidate division KSB1 bacterium]|nr:PDZ domain-containing protein [candidate division KSB1 bacterium]
VNLVRNIADDLREHGKSVRGIMGIQFNSIEDHETMRNYKLDNPYGAVITDFTSSDSPAKEAGIRIDDVIVAIDNQQFTRGGQLQTLLAGKNPGDRIKVTISRGGNKRNILVTLGEMPEEEAVPLIANTLINRAIGITLQEADDGRRLRRGEPRGVLVIGVSRNSSADDQNINIGDYIFKIDKTEINSLDDFRKAMDRYGNQRSVVFYIRNDKGTDLKNIRLR